MSIERGRVAAVCLLAVMIPAYTWPAQQAGTVDAAPALLLCGQAQATAERTIGMMEQRLEAARRENSPSAMRAAIDDLQSALRRLRADLAPCSELQPPAGAVPHPGHVMPGVVPAPTPANPHQGHTDPGKP